METIIYQGREVQATRVNYLSGVIPTTTVDMEGDEELFRDEAGRYYLRRELNWMGINDDTGAGERRASGRVLTHRINVNAAILWATTRINSETLDLRSDAAALLMENRGYSDPFPLHMNAAWRNETARQSTAKSAPHGITAGLDDLASAMLRAACREGTDCLHPGEDPRDLINAAVTYYLCGDDNHRQGQFDLETSDDALQRAKQARLNEESEVAA